MAFYLSKKSGSSIVCGCASAPTGCCLYPWAGFNGGSFSLADLPDTLTLQVCGVVVTLNKVGGYEIYSGGNYFIWSGPGSWVLEQADIAPNCQRFPPPCEDYSFALVGDWTGANDPDGACDCATAAIVEDNFPDTYQVSEYSGYGGWVLTRGASVTLNTADGPVTLGGSACCWVGQQSGGGGWGMICYNWENGPAVPYPQNNQQTFGWNFVDYYLDYGSGLWVGNGGGKDAPQSSPLGIYNGENVFEYTIIE